MLNAPDVMPHFWKFAAVIGAVISVAALSVVLGLAALVKIFGPKKEKE